MTSALLSRVEHRTTPADAADLPPELRGIEYVTIVVDRSPEATQAFVDRTVERYCPNGHKSDAKPGDYCDRCGLYVPHPPEPTVQERISAEFCSKGHTAPKSNGACARCGASIAPPHPQLG